MTQKTQMERPEPPKSGAAPVKLDINYYVSAARAAMDIKDWCTAWGHWGSVLVRTTDLTDEKEYRQLEKKCYLLMLNRKDKKKAKADKENRWKRNRSDDDESYS